MTQPSSLTQPVSQSGTFRIGGDLAIHRLGYGAMQITGPGIWGYPDDPEVSIEVLRRAVSLGVTFIDTADSYGPNVSEELIRRALHPYRETVIATKAGLTRTGPGHWHPVGFPEYLKQQCELSLRRLGVETIDLFQLHRIDSRLPVADQLGALVELQQEGKIRHIGMSEVTVSELQAGLQVAPIASVQNLYNLTNRTSEPLLRYCEGEGIAFIPWFPIATGELASPDGPLQSLAADEGQTPAQLALAWLLACSPVTIPIPGTNDLDHLLENCEAASVTLSDAALEQLSQMSPAGIDPERTGTARSRRG